MDKAGFDHLMQSLADAWSSADPIAAVRCFTDDIVYVDAMNRQRYAGLPALYESSGDDSVPKSMIWHHLAFDTQRQIGTGEYTFRGLRQYHGIVIVQLRDGKISRWREYQYQDEAERSDSIEDS
ncbi:nuclear transport factor 2 family protein [Nonomuraea sp. KM90]|uniref:nuclear transport factor 2 family protein n=1 Tax=Nonomuraea sp. KM90 TaxID=3457428 RepID=UPI003FCCAA84